MKSIESVNGSYLSIVIPAYNEEGNIYHTINEITDYLKSSRYKYEIIVVDDASKDNTALAVEDFIKRDNRVYLLRNGCNKGKGYAVKKGILNSKGQYIFFTDATLFYPIKELDRLLKILEKNDVVIASRFHPEAKVRVSPPSFRKISSYVFNFFARMVIIPGILDTQCGLKGFHRKAALDIFNRQTLNGFGFDIEILHLAHKKNYRIIEAPIEILYSHSPNSKVSLLKDGFRIFKDLIRVKINEWSHKYEDARQFYRDVLNYYDMAALQRQGYYDKKGSAAFKYQRRLREIIKAIIKTNGNSKENNKILDLGCGKGDFSLELLKSFPYSKVIGMDFSEEMIKLSIPLMQKIKNVKFIRGNFMNIPFMEKAFDVVIVLGVICCIHPDDIEKVISELTRVTKTDIVLEIKNKFTPFYLFRKLEPIIIKSKLTVYGNTIRQTQRQVDKYGFKLTKIIPVFKLNFISPSIILKFTRR